MTGTIGARGPLRRAPLLAALLAAPIGALAGCDQDQKEGPVYEAPPRLSLQASEPGGGRFRLTAPRSIPAGVVRMRLENRGKLPHRAQLMRVDGRRSRPEVISAVRKALVGGPIPRWLRPAGGVGPTEPGATTTAVQELPSGFYYALDTGSPEGGEQAPRYFERGAIAAFRISGRGGAAVPPPTPSHVAALDYRFMALNLRAGKNLVRFENAGKEPHQLFAAPIAHGETIEDVRKALKQPLRGTEPRDRLPLGLESAQQTTVLESRTGQVTEMLLKRGRYALLCFSSDRAGGPPHAAKGMVAQARVR